MSHPVDAGTTRPAAHVAICNYNSQRGSPPRTKWEPLIPDKEQRLSCRPPILRTYPPIIASSVYFSSFSDWLSKGIITARLRPWDALTLWRRAKYDHFPSHRWQEIRWCHDECGQCLFYSDELTGDCGFTTSQMWGLTSENWARRK